MIRDLKNHVKPRSIFWLVSYYPWLLKVGYWLKAKQRSRRQIGVPISEKKKKQRFCGFDHFLWDPLLGEANNSNLWQFCRISPYNTAFVWVGNKMTAVWFGCFWMAKKPSTKSSSSVTSTRMSSSGSDTREKPGEPKCEPSKGVGISVQKWPIWSKKKKHRAEACPTVEEDTDV